MIDTALIAERFKAARERLDIGQREAAALIGITPQLLNNWESKNRSPPKLANIERAAAAYGVSPAYLLGWIDTIDINSNGDFVAARRKQVPTADKGDPICFPCLDTVAWHNKYLESREIAATDLIEVIAPDDSMAPTILRGDLVLIERDLSAHEKIDSGLYFIAQDGRCFIRSVTTDIGRALISATTSPAAQQELVLDQKHITLIGRVRAIVRDL